MRPYLSASSGAPSLPHMRPSDIAYVHMTKWSFRIPHWLKNNIRAGYMCWSANFFCVLLLCILTGHTTWIEALKNVNRRLSPFLRMSLSLRPATASHRLRPRLRQTATNLRRFFSGCRKNNGEPSLIIYGITKTCIGARIIFSQAIRFIWYHIFHAAIDERSLHIVSNNI